MFNFESKYLIEKITNKDFSNFKRLFEIIKKLEYFSDKNDSEILSILNSSSIVNLEDK